MNTPRRTIRVWMVLVVAMTLTTGLLGMLQTEKGSSTQFSLSSYYVNSAYSLDVLSISSSAVPFKWRGVSLEKSSTEAGDISTLTLAKDLSSSDLLNYHFVICNGFGTGGEGTENDGLIQPTARWSNQYPCMEEGNWQMPGYVRICVIGDQKITAKQRKSIQSLIDGICHNCDISSDRVRYDF
ncbi:MAG: hypothetical protein ACIAQZ_10450 [Sedimentisphaeraceae bacterium JB056]